MQAKADPTNLTNHKLVSRNLPAFPACRDCYSLFLKLGGAYEWSISNGNQAYHLRCTSQHTPTISHVCIHENQPPMAK